MLYQMVEFPASDVEITLRTETDCLLNCPSILMLWGHPLDLGLSAWGWEGFCRIRNSLLSFDSQIRLFVVSPGQSNSPGALLRDKSGFFISKLPSRSEGGDL